MSAKEVYPCDKCQKYIKSAWMNCPKCGMSLASPKDIEIKNNNMLSNIIKNYRQNDQILEQIMKDISGAESNYDFSRYPFIKKIAEFLANIVTKQGIAYNHHNSLRFGPIFSVDCAQLKILQIDAFTENEFLRLIANLTSNIFILSVCNVDQPAPISTPIVIFTQEEIEDNFDFLKGKNWVKPLVSSFSHNSPDFNVFLPLVGINKDKYEEEKQYIHYRIIPIESNKMHKEGKIKTNKVYSFWDIFKMHFHAMNEDYIKKKIAKMVTDSVASAGNSCKNPAEPESVIDQVE